VPRLRRREAVGSLSLWHWFLFFLVLAVMLAIPNGVSRWVGPRHTLWVFTLLGILVGVFRTDQPWQSEGLVVTVIGSAVTGLLWAGIAIGIVALIRLGLKVVRPSQEKISN
jgi:hypothetical protein